MSRRPNFVLIMADQLRASHVGFGGNPTVQTPNLDRLADSGAIFSQAYVANPICMPNRASLMTGTMPSVHGTRFNGLGLDPRANTFVQQLRQSGYATGMVGKCHLQNIGDQAKNVRMWLGEPPDVDGLDMGPEGWDSWELTQRYRDPDAEHEVAPDYYGFDHVRFAVNHSDYCGGHYEMWLREQGVDIDRGRGPRNPAEVADEWWQVYKPQLTEEQYPTTWITDRAIDFIDSSARDDGPFFMQISYPDPHHPFTPPGKYWDMYSPSDVEVPKTFHEPGKGQMSHLERMRNARGSQNGRMAPWAPTEDQLRRSLAAEYGAITMIDDAVGRIIDAVKAAGEFDNTWFIFTSDHGDMFGDHGILLKSAMHFEGCVRVPLFFSNPDVTATGERSSLASTLDISSTILDLAGVPENGGMQGVSLVPALRDRELVVRDRVFIEEDEMYDPFGEATPLQMRSVITHNARLTRYLGQAEGELYDLQADPHEQENSFNAPEAAELKGQLTDALLDSMMQHADKRRYPRYQA